MLEPTMSFHVARSMQESIVSAVHVAVDWAQNDGGRS